MDRLVTQSYQDWVHKVYDAAYGQVPGEVILTPDSQACHILRPATVRWAHTHLKDHSRTSLT